MGRGAMIEHLIARRNTGSISPRERYEAATMVNALKKRFQLSEDACSDNGLASMTPLIEAMSDQVVTIQDRNVVQLDKLSPSKK